MMPSLDLGNLKQGKSLGLRVFATMLYPVEEKKREIFRLMLIAQMIARDGYNPQTFESKDIMKIIRTLLDAPPSKIMYREAQKQLQYGAVAGYTLLLVRCLDNQGQIGSINKAMYMLERLGKAGQQTPLGTSIPRSRTTLYNKAWGVFKPVAHLWTAYLLTYGSLNDTPTVPPALFPTADATPTFLALAEDFRRFGEKKIPHAQTGPILSEHHTWRVPDDFPLPKPPDNLPVLSPKVWQSLDKYHAPIPTY